MGRAEIVALQEARQHLVEELQTAGWLDKFPPTGGQVQTGYLAGDRRLVDPLTGRPEPTAVPQRPLREVLNDLLRDSEQLPLSGPLQPTSDDLRWLKKKSVMLERVDAEGGVHQQPFGHLPPNAGRPARWRS